MSFGLNTLEAGKPVGLCENSAVHPGKLVKRWRIERELSLEDLADRSGTDKMNLSKIERGMRNPRIGTLQKLADALDVPLGVLLTDGGPNLSTPPDTPVPSMKEGADVPASVERARYRDFLLGIQTAAQATLDDIASRLAELDAEESPARRNHG